LGFKNDLLQEMNLVDTFGHQTKIVFSKQLQNPVIETKTFLFKPPKGVDVVGE
jgi:outer membrane lipoprotein carrier protein